MTSAVILAFSDYLEPAEALAAKTGLPLEHVDLHRFPDGETRVRLPEHLPESVILCRSLHDPNAKLVELLLAAAGARELGATRLTLVAPYLCYMRQDKAFHPGEVVSQRVVGHWLAEHFDALLTVDAHLHRVASLTEAVPTAQAVNVTATRPMADFLARRFAAPMLVGPDAESRQWVAAIAERDGFDHLVCEKTRLGDREVRIRLPEADFHGRDVVLVDDVASTGKTLLEAARQVARHDPATISVLVTHALFLGDAIDTLHRAGVGHIWSCDSIPHPTNAVPLAGLLADTLMTMNAK